MSPAPTPNRYLGIDFSGNHRMWRSKTRLAQMGCLRRVFSKSAGESPKSALARPDQVGHADLNP